MVGHLASIGNGDAKFGIPSQLPMEVFCAEDRINELLRLPAPRGWCTHGSTAHLESVANARIQRFARFSCNSWGCRVCSARKRLSAGRHYAMRLLLANGVLFERSYHPEEWDALRKGFQRSKRGSVSWVRIGCAGRPGIIIGCRPVPDGWTVFSDREQAVRRLGDVLREMVPVRTRLNTFKTDCPSLFHPSYILLSKEAARLNISTTPEVEAAAKKLRRYVHMADVAFHRNTLWKERQMFSDDVFNASVAADRVILRAWGISWPGYLPHHPPGQHAPTTSPAWVDELTD